MNSSILVWDADGVIFDGTMEILARVFGHSLHQRYGIPQEIGMKYMYDTTGTPTAKQYRDFLSERRLLPTGIAEADALINTLVADFTKKSYAEIPPLCPDVSPTLPYLEGLPMAVSTNAPQTVLDRRIVYHSLNRYFTSWFGKTDKTPDKRAHKQPIMLSLGVDDSQFRERGVLIGDGYTDMRIAREWGIKAIGRKTKDNEERKLREAGAIVVVNSLEELPSLIKSLFS